MAQVIFFMFTGKHTKQNKNVPDLGHCFSMETSFLGLKLNLNFGSMCSPQSAPAPHSWTFYDFTVETKFIRVRAEAKRGPVRLQLWGESRCREGHYLGVLGSFQTEHRMTGGPPESCHRKGRWQFSAVRRQRQDSGRSTRSLILSTTSRRPRRAPRGRRILLQENRFLIAHMIPSQHRSWFEEEPINAHWFCFQLRGNIRKESLLRLTYWSGDTVTKLLSDQNSL